MKTRVRGPERNTKVGVLDLGPTPPRDTECFLGEWGTSVEINRCLFLDRTFKITLKGPHSRSVTVKEGQLKARLPIRDKRQKFFAACLFYFTVHRSRENLQNPPKFTYITILVALSHVAYR